MRVPILVTALLALMLGGCNSSLPVTQPGITPVVTTQPATVTPVQVLTAVTPLIPANSKAAVVALQAAPIANQVASQIAANPGNTEAAINAISSGGQVAAVTFGGPYGGLIGLGILLAGQIALAVVHKQQTAATAATHAATVSQLVTSLDTSVPASSVTSTSVPVTTAVIPKP